MRGRMRTGRPPLAAIRLLALVLACAVLGAYRWVAPSAVERTVAVRVAEDACITPGDHRRVVTEGAAWSRGRSDAHGPPWLDLDPFLPAPKAAVVSAALAAERAPTLDLERVHAGVVEHVPTARGPPARSSHISEA